MPDTRILYFLLPWSALLAVAMYYGGWHACKEWLAKLETPIQMNALAACAPLTYCTRIVPGNPWGNAVQFEFNEPPQHAIIYRTPVDELARETRIECVEIHVLWRKSLHFSFMNGAFVDCHTIKDGRTVSVPLTTEDLATVLALLDRVRSIAARPWK